MEYVKKNIIKWKWIEYRNFTMIIINFKKDRIRKI